MIKLKLVFVLLTVMLVTILNFRVNELNNVSIQKDIINSETIVCTKPSIKMFYYIKKYCKEFDVPEQYVFSLAYQETRYQGPLHFNYNSEQVSCAGALGPMQIMPATAKLIYGSNVSTKRLLTDIKLNIFISIKLLRCLHDKYHDWGLVFGAYNTGKPCINKYAMLILNKQYNWKTVSDININNQ